MDIPIDQSFRYEALLRNNGFRSEYEEQYSRIICVKVH